MTPLEIDKTTILSYVANRITPVKSQISKAYKLIDAYNNHNLPESRYLLGLRYSDLMLYLYQKTGSQWLTVYKISLVNYNEIQLKAMLDDMVKHLQESLGRVSKQPEGEER